MNLAQIFSLARTALTIGGTTVGVHAALSPDFSTLTVALGAAGPVVAIIWSMFTHSTPSS